jgi:hypothetical protein
MKLNGSTSELQNKSSRTPMKKQDIEYISYGIEEEATSSQD